MHSVNANVAISRIDTFSPAAAAPQAVATPANRTRRPLILLKGGASVRFPGAASGISPESGGRGGAIAACLSILHAAMTQVATKRKTRAEARMRRIVQNEMTYLSDHTLRDIGLSRGRIDAALRDAPLHGPRL